MGFERNSQGQGNHGVTAITPSEVEDGVDNVVPRHRHLRLLMVLLVLQAHAVNARAAAAVTVHSSVWEGRKQSRGRAQWVSNVDMKKEREEVSVAEGLPKEGRVHVARERSEMPGVWGGEVGALESRRRRKRRGERALGRAREKQQLGLCMFLQPRLRALFLPLLSVSLSLSLSKSKSLSVHHSVRSVVSLHINGETKQASL